MWKENITNEESDNIHFFVNFDNKIVWQEYRGENVIQNYTLFKYIGTDLILKKQNMNNSYVKLTMTDYSIGSLESLSDPKRKMIPGFWRTKPVFTNSK